MDFALAALFLAPGLAIGSFLNVVASRLPLGRSIVRPRSACMSCATPIAPRDNVPLLSYALLRGRCRSCDARIPLRYPLVELATALLVAGCALAFGPTGRTLAAALFCVALVTVSATDVEHLLIPNRIVVPAGIAVLALDTVARPSPSWAIAAFGAAGFFLVAALVYPAGLGMGDVKLAFLLGAGLGPATPLAILVGMVAALVPAVVLFARHGAKARKMAIPLGVFLALGGAVALFAGGPVMHAYWNAAH